MTCRSTPQPMGFCSSAIWMTTVLLLIQTDLAFFDTNGNVEAPREYCNMEIFNATCQQNEVIVMESARYGRMNFGRCVKGNYGYLGCAVDVLGYMDYKCSGSHICWFNVPDQEMYRTTPCPGDFTSYLEASYRCVRVATGDTTHCRRRKPIILKGHSGYIASKITEDTGLGTRDCPWIVEVDPGQRINVTLLNFARTYKLPSSGLRSTLNMDVCFDVIQMSEGAGDRAVVNLCVRDQRESNIYLSKTNKLTIVFLDKRLLATVGNFLIKYDAISCPDVRPPPDAWVRRDGDTLMIRCNNTQETWYLTCRNDNWVGELGNCSTDYRWSLAHVILDQDSFPYGVLAVVAIGVVLGVIIGGVLLAVIFIVSKRNKRNQSMRVYKDNKENLRILDSNNSNNGAIGSTTIPEWIREGQYTDEGIVRDIRSPAPGTRHSPRVVDGVDRHVTQSDDNVSHVTAAAPPLVCDVIPPNESFSTFRPRAHFYESPNVT